MKLKIINFLRYQIHDYFILQNFNKNTNLRSGVLQYF